MQIVIGRAHSLFGTEQASKKINITIGENYLDMVEAGRFFLIIIAAMAGFLVGQANGFLERRNEKRKAYSRTLSELLEIRHRFKGAVYVLRRLACDIEVPRKYLDEIVQGLPDGLLWDTSISNRYADAISTLSAYDPLSAYFLRSKDVVGLFLDGSQIFFGPDELSHSIAMKHLEMMEEGIVPAIEQSIEDASKFLGKKTSKVTREILEETQEVLPQVKDIIDELIANANAAIAEKAKH